MRDLAQERESKENSNSHAVNLVTLLEEELSEVGTVLTRNTYN
jgi:hypothetical protein